MSDLGSNMSPREFAERIIEEMEQADRVVIETKNTLGEMDAHYVLAKDLAAAIRDLARPAPQPVGVKVKPLVWYDPPEGETYRIGRCGQIAYTVQFDFGRWGYRSKHTNGFVISRKGGVLFKDQADAMAGCDEDHERRILSALDPQPARTFTEDEALAARQWWARPDEESLMLDYCEDTDGSFKEGGWIRVREVLTPTDATAALARVIKAAEAKGRRKALEEAWPAVREVICSQDWTDCDGDVFCDAIETAIRALIEKEGQVDE